jgi:hypothetical protein
MTAQQVLDCDWSAVGEAAVWIQQYVRYVGPAIGHVSSTNRRAWSPVALPHSSHSRGAHTTATTRRHTARSFQPGVCHMSAICPAAACMPHAPDQVLTLLHRLSALCCCLQVVCSSHGRPSGVNTLHDSTLPYTAPTPLVHQLTPSHQQRAANARPSWLPGCCGPLAAHPNSSSCSLSQTPLCHSMLEVSVGYCRG